MNRRGFLGGLLAAAVAPAIIRTPGLIMPIKPALVPVRCSMMLRTNGGSFIPVEPRNGSLIEGMARACATLRTVDFARGAVFMGDAGDVLALEAEVIRDRQVLYAEAMPIYGRAPTMFRGIPVVEREQYYRRHMQDRMSHPPLVMTADGFRNEEWTAA